MENAPPEQPQSQPVDALAVLEEVSRIDHRLLDLATERVRRRALEEELANLRAAQEPETEEPTPAAPANGGRGKTPKAGSVKT